MIFLPTPVEGAYHIEIEPSRDDRGFFSRVTCEKEFHTVGINPLFKQCNMQFNKKAGTLRGMHLQHEPFAEEKLIRCTRGAIFDVIVDMREGSASYLKWFGMELSAENRTMLYIPKGVAHGYVTITDEAETFYMVTEFYAPEYEWGVRFDDPIIGIDWPDIKPLVISKKDRGWPLVVSI